MSLALGCSLTVFSNSSQSMPSSLRLTDSTFGFYIDESSVTDPKEDFHTEVLSLLVQANQLAVCKGEDRAVLRTLSSFIAKRHLFLEKI